MPTSQPSLSDIRRDNHRKILAALRSEEVLLSVSVCANGRIQLQSVPWERYWIPAIKDQPAHMVKLFQVLTKHRSAYIAGGFSLELAQTYCHSFFCMLRALAEEPTSSRSMKRLRHALLCAESTGLRIGGQEAMVAGVTSTLRNPAYLLARLGQPNAAVDPKFLPLIPCGYHPSDPDVVPELYYHYRQYKLDGVRGGALLTYPAVRPEVRSESFRCLQAFTFCMAQRTDPRTRSRSEWIAELAIAPFLADCPKSDYREPVKIADLGGGSGELARLVCEKVLHNCDDLLGNRRISWTLVDVMPHNIHRLKKRRQFLRRTAEIRCERIDWREWIGLKSEEGAQFRYDITLCCRLIDNLSKFSIASVDDWHQVRKLSARNLTRLEWVAGSYLPHICLAPNGPGPAALLASSARIPLRVGTTYLQLSLTDYYKVLFALSRGGSLADSDQGSCHFPVRRIDPDSFDLANGQSALDVLCSLSKLLVIEDVDFNKVELLRHLTGKDLSEVAASDVTDGNRMHGTNLLCLCHNKHAAWLPGRRIH